MFSAGPNSAFECFHSSARRFPAVGRSNSTHDQIQPDIRPRSTHYILECNKTDSQNKLSRSRARKRNRARKSFTFSADRLSFAYAAFLPDSGRRSGSGPLQQRHTGTASFTCRHYKENDHGQRTTAQDQGSKETQEATGACQVTGAIQAFDAGWVRRRFLRRNPTNQIITPIGDIENRICRVARFNQPLTYRLMVG